MTRAYEWNPMPHCVAVRCPECLAQATFEFAEIVQIKKADVPFFERSKQFDYRFVESDSGQRWHAAIYYSGLHGHGTDPIRDLPEGYAPSQWDHPRYLVRTASNMNLGSVRCQCGIRRKHQLIWPRDAYFQLDDHGATLWAFDRDSALSLRSFIASAERDPKAHRWAGMLMKVPKQFLVRHHSDAILTKLDRLLSQS